MLYEIIYMPLYTLSNVRGRAPTEITKFLFGEKVVSYFPPPSAIRTYLFHGIADSPDRRTIVHRDGGPQSMTTHFGSLKTEHLVAHSSCERALREV